MALINDIVNNLIGDQVNAPVAKIEKAVEATKANPSSEQIIADIKMALDLFVEFKKSVDILHPSAWAIIKFLL